MEIPVQEGFVFTPGTPGGKTTLPDLGDAYDVTFGFTATPTLTFSSETDTSTAAADVNDALNEMAIFPNFLEGNNAFAAYYVIP